MVGSWDQRKQLLMLAGDVETNLGPSVYDKICFAHSVNSHIHSSTSCKARFPCAVHIYYVICVV